MYLLISVVVCSFELEHKATLDLVKLSYSITCLLEYNNIMFLEWLQVDNLSALAWFLIHEFVRRIVGLYLQAGHNEKI
jgi:hypothetical protein